MIFICPYIGNVIIPTGPNSIIFQRGRAKNHEPEMICVLEFPDFHFFHRKLVPPISARCLWNTRICWVFPFFWYFPSGLLSAWGIRWESIHRKKYIYCIWYIYIYIWTSKAIPGTWDFTETRGGYMDVWISQGHMCYFSGCELLNFRGVSDEHMNLLREAKSKDVISLYHLGVSENGVYPKWPFSSGKSVVFSWGILKWVDVEAKALFLNGCFA